MLGERKLNRQENGVIWATLLETSEEVISLCYQTVSHMIQATLNKINFILPLSHRDQSNTKKELKFC